MSASSFRCPCALIAIPPEACESSRRLPRPSSSNKTARHCIWPVQSVYEASSSSTGDGRSCRLLTEDEAGTNEIRTKCDASSESFLGGAQNKRRICCQEAFEEERNLLEFQIVRDIIIGLSDGLMVPFALTAGLSTLGSSRLVYQGGFAELISGAISMGIGGYLSAKGEQDIFRHRLSAISKRLGNACEPEVQREIHNVLGPFGVNPSLSRLVAKNLQIIEHEEAIKQDLPDEPQARTAQFLAAGFLGWPLRVATRLTAPTRGTAAFLIQLGEGMREVSNMRLYVSAMTIGLSYFVGGLIPIIPYLCVPDALHGLYWSILATGITLVLFGLGKAWFTGAAKGAWGLAWGAISMLGVGGAAAAASFGVVKALARSQA